MFFVILHLIQVFLVVYNHANKYCDIKCSQGTHTMCTYVEGGGPNCAAVTRGLSGEQKKAVLVQHNQLRQRIALGQQDGQPSATNMMVLTWDDEGAEIAQRWADQCTQRVEQQATDTCRDKLNGEHGGQNIYAAMPENSLPDLNGVLTRKVLDWFSVENFFKYSDEYIVSKQSESYSQIVWAATTTLGCGMIYNNSEDQCLIRFVCNYYPAGNIEGEMIYKKGLACSQCPAGSGCSKSWPGLCTTVAEDKGGKLPPDAFNTESSVDRIHFSLILYTSCLSQLGFYYRKL